MNKGYIKFWGVRGSNPTPDTNKIKYGGDTSCVEIKTALNDTIILDMGTGIRNLGDKIISDPSYSKEINIFLQIKLRFRFKKYVNKHEEYYNKCNRLHRKKLIKSFNLRYNRLKFSLTLDCRLQN